MTPAAAGRRAREGGVDSGPLFLWRTRLLKTRTSLQLMRLQSMITPRGGGAAWHRCLSQEYAPLASDPAGRASSGLTAAVRAPAGQLASVADSRPDLGGKAERRVGLELGQALAKQFARRIRPFPPLRLGRQRFQSLRFRLDQRGLVPLQHRVLAPQRLPWRAIPLTSRAAGTSSGAMSFAAPLIGPATMGNSVGGLLLNTTPTTLREGGMLALEKLL